MTRSSVLILCLIACLGLTTWLNGAGGAGMAVPAEPARIAIVDLERVMSSLLEAKDAEAALKKVEQEKLQAVQEIVDRLKAAQAAADEAPKGTQARLQALAFVYELEAQFKARRDGNQRLLDLRAGDSIRGLYLKILDAVGVIAQRGGHDFVIVDDRSIVPPEMGSGQDMNARISTRRLLYAGTKPGLDISDEVIAKMNNDYTAGRRN